MKWGKYLLCIGCGVIFFFGAELADNEGALVENGRLKRNSCGQGESVYEVYVDGLEEEEVKLSISIPEQRLSPEEFEVCVPDAVELLKSRMIGENFSLEEVRQNLNLESSVPEYGMEVTWESQRPELVSRYGTVNNETVGEQGELVALSATLTNGAAETSVTIQVRVYPPNLSTIDRFLQQVRRLAYENMEESTVLLPDTFEGTSLSYRGTEGTQNLTFVALGIVAALCLYLKEKKDAQDARKKREASLMEDYPDLVSGFLILTGAGYPAKAAWKKLLEDFKRDEKRGTRPLAEEMQVAVNQMETGMPETRAYAAFGKRCGIRCYVKFASLLESSVSTGGKNLKKLLEAEMEDAMKQRTDLARRKGEEASSSLLIPMFGMLGIVMVMVVAPAFLSLK